MTPAAMMRSKALPQDTEVGMERIELPYTGSKPAVLPLYYIPISPTIAAVRIERTIPTGTVYQAMLRIHGSLQESVGSSAANQDCTQHLIASRSDNLHPSAARYRTSHRSISMRNHNTLWNLCNPKCPSCYQTTIAWSHLA